MADVLMADLCQAGHFSLIGMVLVLMLRRRQFYLFLPLSRSLGIFASRWGRVFYWQSCRSSLADVFMTLGSSSVFRMYLLIVVISIVCRCSYVRLLIVFFYCAPSAVTISLVASQSRMRRALGSWILILDKMLIPSKCLYLKG